MLINTAIILGVYSLFLFFFISPLSHFLLFLAGIIIGFLVVYLDKKYLYKYYQDQTNTNLTAENFSQNAGLQTDGLSNDANFYQSNNLALAPKQYITHSLLFLLVFVALAIYLITSGGNRLAQGIIMGLGLTLLSKMFSLVNQSELFKQQFLWQLKTKVGASDVKKIVLAMLVFLALLTIKII